MKVSDNILKKAYEIYKEEHSDSVYYIFESFIDCVENPNNCVEDFQKYIKPLIQEERINKLNRIIEK